MAGNRHINFCTEPSEPVWETLTLNNQWRNKMLNKCWIKKQGDLFIEICMEGHIQCSWGPQEVCPTHPFFYYIWMHFGEFFLFVCFLTFESNHDAEVTFYHGALRNESRNLWVFPKYGQPMGWFLALTGECKLEMQGLTVPVNSIHPTSQ